MKTLEETCFEIISFVGNARSLYIEAIQASKQNNPTRARQLLEEGDEMFREGHHAHLALFQSEVSKDFSLTHILLMHAEDQLMSAEGFKIVATEFIDLYETFIHEGERSK